MKLKKLIRELRRKLRRDEGNLALRLELAALYRESGQVEDAVATYHEVALSCLHAGQLDDAMNACRSALDLVPEHVELRSLMADIRRAWRGGSAEHDSGPRRRAQIWSTQEVQEVAAEAMPESEAEVPERPERHASESGGVPARRAPRARSTGPREVYASAQAESRGSQLAVTPTPLPAPLALHDAVDDSLASQQPWLRLKSQISGPVPAVSLPGDLVESDDELLAVDDAGSGTDPDAGHEPDDDDDDTDVRELASADPPAEDGRGSEDLTRPVLRLDTESPVASMPAGAGRPHEGAVAVSGEISLDDPGQGAGPAGEPEEAAGDRLEDSSADDSGDETTLVKELPEPPVLPGTTSAVVRAPVTDPESAELTMPVSRLATDESAGTDAGEDGPDTSETALDVEAVDEDKILAEEALAGSERSTRRRPAAPTLMDLAPPVPQAAASVQARTDALARAFPSFPAHVVEALAEQVALRSFADSEYVFQEGEPGRACFVIASGTVRLLRRDPFAQEHPLAETARLGRGALFGEHALLAERRRQGAAQAVGDCRVYEIPRRALRELVAVHDPLGPLVEVFYRDHLVALLVETAPFLRALPPPWRQSLRARFRPLRRTSGEAILRQGERTGGLYLVMLGSVEITQRVSDHRARLLATLGEGAYFADMSALDEHATAGATVSAAGPVELAVLGADEFLAAASESPLLWDEIRSQGRRKELEQSQILTGETALV